MSRTKDLTPHVDALVARSRAHAAAGAWDEAWSALELAHVISQPSASLHVKAHAEMLRLALRVGDVREVLGQLLRMTFGGIASAAGRFPAGNTGRARVSAFAPMPIPEEARRVFAELGIDVEGVTIAGRRR